MRDDHPLFCSDLLSVLCTAEILGAPPRTTISKRFARMLFGAGGDTTNMALASLFKNLLDHSEQLVQLREDRSLLGRAIVESLRYSSPTYLLLRTANAEVQVSGGVIPENALVAACIGAANHDPGHFKDPDRFDIHR